MKLCKYFTYLILLYAISSKGYSQGNNAVITSSVPANITVCGAAETFTATINNVSASALTSITITATLPTGVNYVAGSQSGVGITEFDISNLNKPIFASSDITAGSTASFTFMATANCNLITYQSSGQPIKDSITVNYTGNYDSNVSLPFNVLKPSLVFTTITNQSYTGNVNATFARSFTITNSGNGSLSSLKLSDVHGSSIQITASNVGIISGNGLNDTITLSGIDFTSIGNNNATLDNGESISIIETVKINGCLNLGSNIDIFWGCDNLTCQKSSTTANVIVANGVPKLDIVPTGSTESCYNITTPRVSKLKIVNSGTGVARGVSIDILLGYYGNFYPWMQTNIDLNSFTYKKGINGAAVALIADSSTAGSAAACLGPNAKARVYITIPTVSVGDTIYLNWNNYVCCLESSCAGGTPYSYIDCWQYEGFYFNDCNTAKITVPIQQGSWGSYFTATYSATPPTDIIDGQTSTFTFVNTYAYEYLFYQPSSYYKVQFVIPPCLKWSGNPIDLSLHDNYSTNTWSPSSVTYVGDTVTAIYPWATRNLGLYKSYFEIALTADCSKSGCSGGSSGVSMLLFLNTNPACTNQCLPLVNCVSGNVNVHCPSPCPEGMAFNNYSLKRISYGLPDNDDNGLADGVGSLDFTRIRTDRAMMGDTIMGTYSGTVITSLAHPNFAYGYVSSDISGAGNTLTAIDATVHIYDASTSLVYNCTLPAAIFSVAGTTQTFNYDYSVTTLISNGCGIPGAFVFDSGDSVVIKARYTVTSNLGGTMIPTIASNSFYLSHIANPTLSTDKFACDNYSGSISVIGYYFTTYAPEIYNPNSCGNFYIYQYNYLSIGNCCGNYAGGNLFPYEYRNWSHIKKITVIKPPGYDFVSADWGHIGTAGTGGSRSQTVAVVTPVNPGSDTLVFNMNQYFKANGGTVDYSDDGYYDYIYVYLKPGCKTPDQNQQGVSYIENHELSPYLNINPTYDGTSVVSYDQIKYFAPSISLQATLPIIDGYNATESWDVLVTNTTNNSAAGNNWISVTPSPTINVVSVIDVGTGGTITPVGGIYQLGNLNAGIQKKYRITISYSGCNLDSVTVYTGWDCAGYPANLALAKCPPLSLKLYIEPKPAQLQLQVNGPSATVGLCDTATYEATISDILLGSAFNINLSVTLPFGGGLIIEPGSAQALYPQGAAYVAIADPTLVSGSTYKWDLSALIPLINTNGLPGLIDPAKNKIRIRFKVRTDCGFTSGGVIGFKLSGASRCGALLTNTYYTTPPFEITGVIAPNVTFLDIKIDTVRTCMSNFKIRIKLINLGPSATLNNDHYLLLLPPGTGYVAGSFNGVHNAPSIPVPTQATVSGQTQLDWQLPSGIAVDDSVVFNFEIDGSQAGNLNCGTYTFTGDAVHVDSAFCVVTSTNCGIFVLTGTSTSSIIVKKRQLEVTSITGYSKNFGTTGEEVYLNYSVSNTGEALPANSKIPVHFYYDADNNSTVNTGDLLLKTDTVNTAIASNDSINLNSIITNQNGSACKIIALIDTSAINCFCSRSMKYATIQLQNTISDTLVCDGSIINLGNNSVINYQYSWSPITGLSDSFVSNPTVLLNNAGSIDLLSTYILSTTRNNCSSSDTVSIIVKPQIVLNTSKTDVSCNNASTGSASVIVTGGVGPLQYDWQPGSINATSISNVNSGTYTVSVTDNLGCSTTSVVILTQATAITSSTVVDSSKCNLPNGQIDIDLSGGTGTYSYSWSGGAGAFTTTQFIIIDSLAPGNYLFSVTDVNGCAYNTMSSVYSIPAPQFSTIAGTNVSCKNGADGSAFATVSNGSIPYNYTWSNGFSTSATTAISDSIKNIPNGTYSLTLTDSKGCVINTSVTITEPTQNFVGTLSFANPTCVVNGNVSLTVSGGNSGVYTYSWSTSFQETIASSTSQISNLNAGNYSVTASDSKGCLFDTSITLIPPVVPVLTSDSVKNVKCNGDLSGSVYLSVSGGITPLSYTWSTGSTSGITDSTLLIGNLGAGNYTVTVTNASGCTDIQSVSITQATAITSSTVVDSSKCNLPNGQINIDLSGGTGTYSYSWSGGAGAFTTTQFIIIDSLAPGNYLFSVTDVNGCAYNTMSSVYSIPAPQFSTIAGTNVSCKNGADGSAFATVSNGSIPYNYTWSNGFSTSTTTAISDSIKNIPNGTYSLTLTDSKGCVINTSVTITEPTQNFVGTLSFANPTCVVNGNVSLTVSGGNSGVYTYSWSTSFQETIASSTSQISNLSAGNYSVTASDSKGCLFDTSITLIPPVVPVLTSDSLINIKCNGDLSGSVYLSVSGGITPLSYTWSTGSTSGITDSTLLIGNLGAGNYTVTVTNAYGCIDTASITLSQPPGLNVNFEITSANCTFDNGQIIASVSGGVPVYKYTWSNASIDSNNINLAPGNYGLTVIDNNSCQINSNATVGFIPAYTIDIQSTSINILEGETITLQTNPGYTYSWSPANSVDCQTCEKTNVSPSITTTYTVTTSDSNGCLNSATITIYVLKPCTSENDVFVANVFSPNGDLRNDVLSVKGNGLTNLHWSIYNRWGELVFNNDSDGPTWNGSYKGQALDEGTYVYYLTGTCKVNNSKIILKGDVTLIR